ncbi:hypothetical protein JQN72_12150 [Phycicoccus sp. CSK15P-2]|uniref:hypothetical protein n=1 Tax=Phycicoccus sp. CSK15P-2 TaxID=2807627 RepID=UPI00194EC02C|nr:hypothetical protein [Phycicoccus sp. CSK15P-2]MBM6404994.1 hypothetical protein [Phycicoccus sp. CSK15P-2]
MQERTTDEPVAPHEPDKTALSEDPARPNGPARPSRRTVATGLAWAVPVVGIGAAAPKASASPCPPDSYVMSWGGSSTTYTRNSSTSATAVTDPDGAGWMPPVTLSIASVLDGRMATGNESGSQNQNLRISSGTVGGTSSRGLQLEQTVTGTRNSVPGRSARQTVTFSFSRPVTGLSFTMTDIDAVQGDFVDMVELSGAFTYSYNSTWLQGSGTQGDPLRPRYWGDRSATENLGNATITYPGTISSFTIVYWNNAPSFSNADRNQIVTFTDFSFQVIRQDC